MTIIEQLKKVKEETLPYFDLSEEDLNKTYAEGKWTVRQLLHHIADAETVLYDRIRRAISEPRQVIWAFAQDDWCRELDYENYPLEINKRIYAAVRKAVLHLAEHHYEKNGDNEFIHSETGLRTLKDEFDKVVWHNEHHLEQIRRALD